MKTCTKHLLLVTAVMAALGLVSAGLVSGQTFTTLHNFGGSSDGGSPAAGLVLAGNTLYGTTQLGPSLGEGTVFRVNTDGTGFTNLYIFTNGDDGSAPYAGLILSGNTLYGAAQQGGSSGHGTLFSVNTDGTDFTNIYSFSAFSNSTNTDGSNPEGGLILSGNTLYGTAKNGGSAYGGTVFSVSTDGTDFATLHDFDVYYSDGGFPEAGLVLSNNTLYGTAYDVPGPFNGTVFSINSDGSDFTILHSFTNRNDGSGVVGGLVLSGGTLYGTAYAGGGAGKGTVFYINTNSMDFQVLYSFSAAPGNTNSDGAFPYAGLTLSGNSLYGVAETGGGAANGTVFAVNRDGSGFTTLHSFSALDHFTNSDGSLPYGGVILSGATLYGTASGGGSEGDGTVFALNLTPSLGIEQAGNQVVLSWRTWAPNFNLQSTTNLVAGSWGAVSPKPTVIGGLNFVTNFIIGTQTFYRLSQ